MNMVSKGVQNVLDFRQNQFHDMDVISVSGEFICNSDCYLAFGSSLFWVL